jgi:chromate transporter
MATYIGAEMGGVFGSVCATLGVVLPSFVVILTVAKCYDAFRQSRIVKGCMSGLKPAVVGLIGNAFLNVFLTVFFPAGLSLAVFSGISFYVYVAIFAGMLVLTFKKVHPIAIICLSAAIGIAVGYLGIG